MEYYYTYTKMGDREQIAALAEDGVTLLHVTNTNPLFKKIHEGLRAGTPGVLDLFNKERAANAKFRELSSRLSIKNGTVYQDLEPVHSAIADHIARFVDEGADDWKPLVAFMDRLAANPSEASRNSLYDWLTKTGGFTITDEGMVIGYKGLTAERKSIHAGPAVVNGEQMNGHIPNQDGAVVQMPRSHVDDNTNASCSVGLHIGTWQYATGFGRVVVEVEFDPADAVAVPHGDTNKLRVCRYKVRRVAQGELKGALYSTDDYYTQEEVDESELVDHF